MNEKTFFSIGDKLPLSLVDEYDDQQARSERAESYSIVGASVRGQLHHYNNTGRDDSFAVRFDGTWLAVAVADGAGSCSNSRYGSSYLTNRLCRRLILAVRKRQWPTDNASDKSEPKESNATDKCLGTVALSGIEPNNSQRSLQDIVLWAFRKTRAGLDRFASKNGVKLDELHSTLLVFILNTQTGKMAVGQIGDGLILGLDDKKEVKLLAEPPTTGDPGASYFITQNDWERYLDIRETPREEVEHLSTFFLMTDGVANDCQYEPPPGILKTWANDMDREIRLKPSLEVTAERLKSYLASYKAKGSFDDRTLVAIFKDKVL